MSVFTQNFNPITGMWEWDLQRHDYDYKQEVARSAYADMLHDQERNQKYLDSLKKTIKEIRSRGDEVHVLDIGTGTGLLSMMAVACGADTITACEVHLIAKRSIEIEVGPGKDMERRANLLVTEVFDTELIGEGALQTFVHAKEKLLTNDALIVPSRAMVYAQVVSSKIILRWNRINPILKDGKRTQALLKISNSINTCSGSASVHDLQLSQIPKEWFTALSHPLLVFWFDWSGRKKELKFDELSRTSFKALSSGECSLVFMWWELQMDLDGDIMLSCAPYWAHPDVLASGGTGSIEDIPWRDHWMQAIYYFPKPISAEKGQELTLLSSHDEYSLWFNVQADLLELVNEDRPICDCGFHIACSRTRFGQMNDPRRLEIYVRLLKRHIREDSVCLFLGDTCLVAILAARLGARHVYMTESNETARRAMEDFLISNRVQEKVTVITNKISDMTLSHIVAPINFVFGEPFFTTSLLPWHSLFYWYLLNTSRHLFSSNVVFLPKAASLWAIPVQFRDLWKIRSPLYQCCGYEMDVFDKMIEAACDEADERVEPQPLWEYPTVALSDPVPLLTIKLNDPVPENSFTRSGSTPILCRGIFNGVALWIDWHFSDAQEDILTTGPVTPAQIGQQIEWDVYTRQGVYLLKDPITVGPLTLQILNYSTVFNPEDGSFKFDFDAKQTLSQNSHNS